MKKSTLFCDIDGTLFHYRKFTTYKSTKPDKIFENINAINKAYDNGHYILLTTARPEYLRVHTMKELDEANVQYHKIVMGIARGTRLLINVNEEEYINRAYAINVTRNSEFTPNQMDLFDSITK